MANKKVNFIFQSLVISVITVIAFFLWEGNKGINLADEGLLWYGSQRVMLGEVPIRDFISYDPGRYYWSAIIMFLYGDNGIMTLRGAIAIFQTIGLFVGLYLIGSSSKKSSFFYSLLCALILVAWMHPRHKFFDISLSIIMIGALTLLIKNPTKKSYFIAGFFIGLVAFFGRNHGVYGVVGLLSVLLWSSLQKNDPLNIKIEYRELIAGAVIGFSPLILMLFSIDGFYTAFLDSIPFIFKNDTNNIALQIPYPWRINFISLTLNDAIRKIVIGLLFIALLLGGLVTIIIAIKQKYHAQHSSLLLF